MYREDLEDYIPPRFDLAKYDACINMSLIGWIENISARLLIYLACLQNIEGITPDQMKTFEEIIENNIDMGVLSDTHVRKLIEGVIQDDEADYSSIIKEITYFELFYLAETFKTEELEKLYDEVNFPVFPLINQDSLGELNKPVSFNMDEDAENAWLKVDLTCSKKEIMEAFSRWLTRAKAERDNSENKPSSRERKINIFNEISFRKWHAEKVLPYIDLFIWNKLKGNKVTDQEIGTILYPDPRDIRDKGKLVFFNTKPYVEKLMSIATFRRMLAVHADQNMKKNSKKTS